MAWTKLRIAALTGIAFLIAGRVTLIIFSRKAAKKEETLPQQSGFVLSAPLVVDKDKKTIERWKQMPLTPLTENGRVSALIGKIPIEARETVSPEAEEMLRDNIRAFLAYASSNSFETYTNFLGITPEVKYRLPESEKAFLQKCFPNEPVDSDGQIPLERYFSLLSFGTIGRESNYWRIEAAGLADARILIFSTNRLAESFVEPVAKEEFSSGGISSSNFIFVWPHSKDDILARDGKLTLAVATVYLKSSMKDAGYPDPDRPFPYPDYPYLVALGFYWDSVGHRWVPDELVVRAIPLPRRLLL